MHREEDEINFMILPVPYYSQREEAALQKYGNKACGLTSLRMVLAFYNRSLDMHQLDESARRVGAYDEEQGWIHSGLVSIARDQSLKGYRINFDMLTDQDRANVGTILAREGASLKEIDHFMKTFDTAKTEGPDKAIEQLLAKKIPVIASMDKKFANTSASHLVVITGEQGGKYIINDPWDNGKNYEVDKERFDETWTKRAIVIYEDLNS